MNRTGAHRQAFINSLHKEDAIQLQVSYFIFLGLFRSGPNYTCQSFPLCFYILRCYENDVNEDFDLPDFDKKKTTSMRFCRRFVIWKISRSYQSTQKLTLVTKGMFTPTPPTSVNIRLPLRSRYGSSC